MISNESIILFSSDDWASGLKSSKYHVAVGLAKHNKVLFVNSIGLRNPTISSKDIRRIFYKLFSFFKGYERINENLYVYTPIIIPFHKIKFVRKINQYILLLSLSIIKFVLKLKKPILLVFSPNFQEVTGHLGEKGAVYYCIDELKGYKEVDAKMFENMEKNLLAKADCVVTCSKELTEKKKLSNPDTYYIAHGVDWALFRTTLNEGTKIPEDVVSIRKPVIGFYGFLSEDWIDFDLLNYIASQRPDWSIVLIGRSKLDLSTVLKHKNIHFLGVRQFEDLPKYNKAFEVAIIPFIINELTESSNPLKLFEYLASGLPVVSVNIPEVAKYKDLVKVANSHPEFLAMIEQALKENSEKEKYYRSDFVKNETWDNRLEKLSEIILKHCDH